MYKKLSLLQSLRKESALLSMTELKEQVMMDKKLITKIQEILKQENILEQNIEKYTKDRRGNLINGVSLVLLPETLIELQDLVKLLNQYQVPFAPQGGNTGLVGGTILSEGVLINLKKMNKLIEVDKENATMTVEAGMILQEAHNIAQEHGFLFPIKLPSIGECTIGGNIATNGGGVNVIKYGTTRHNVLGMEYILSNGELINDLHKLRKNNLGPDLSSLMIGSEGILGIVTKAVFKLYPLPKFHTSFLVSSEEIKKIMATFTALRENLFYNITTFEIIHKNAIALSLESLQSTIQVQGKWHALIELEGSDDYFINKALHIIEKQKVTFIHGKNKEEINQLWQIRKIIPDAQKKLGKSIKHDIALPISQMEKVLDYLFTYLTNNYPSLMPIVFGHVGDGNVHFNISQYQMDLEEFEKIKDIIKRQIIDIIMQHGGTFSAEHGVGLVNKKFMLKYKNENYMDILKKVKKVFDKKEILNKDKII